MLTDFHILRPQYETSQEDSIHWLSKAHAETKTISFQDCRELFLRYGCKPEHIQKRGHELRDFLHLDWRKMEVFQLNQSPTGLGLSVRQNIHQDFTDAAFEKYYPKTALPPRHLIHVSCTGYHSPSSAQKLVSRRGWGGQTLVTHAYHMGCYASIPAVRMASSYVAQLGGRGDIVHTELCSLHFNPNRHEPDQIVLQSLFADGYVKYSFVSEKESSKPGLKVILTDEMILPNCVEAMTWKLNDWGFEGYLSVKIPFLIAKHVEDFLKKVAEKADLSLEDLLQKSLFAIHPGGPKILDQLQEILKLKSEQLRYSRQILFQFGNISSATLPHIWETIVNDHQVPKKQYVMSLAFGPGLNIAGALLCKC